MTDLSDISLPGRESTFCIVVIEVEIEIADRTDRHVCSYSERKRRIFSQIYPMLRPDSRRTVIEPSQILEV